MSNERTFTTNEDISGSIEEFPLEEFTEKTQNIEHLRTIKNKSNSGNVGIYYTKTQKLKFPAKKLSFKNIPVLKSVQLSFYEKYSILMLQNGISATTQDDLVNKISNFLNVSKRCIAEFIDYLVATNSINFDVVKGIYKLDDAIHYELSPSLDNAMFAEFDVKQADCDKIMFVENSSDFLLEEDFANGQFSVLTNTRSLDQPLPYSVQDFVYSQKNKLKLLFERAFDNTNMHLTKNFSFELCADKYSELQYQFDAIFEYKYDEEAKQSIRQSTIVPSGNLLSDDYINTLSVEFDLDNELPKFILHKDFYESILPNSSELTSIEDKIEENKNASAPLEKEINTEKATLLSMKKQHTREKKVAEEKAEQIRNEIKQAEENIAINEGIADDNKGSDVDLVKSLKNTIKELLASKETLSNQLEAQEKVITSLTEEFSNTEEKLNNSIKLKEEEIKNINKRISEYESERKLLAKAHNTLLSENDRILNPIIKSVISKYPASDNVMYRSISDICLWLDSAISASDCDSYDEICRSIDFIREPYRKLLQAVFDICLKTKAENLGVYLGDAFHIIEIENMLRKRNVALIIKSQLIQFHNLANAIGHSAENGPKKFENKRRIEGFKELTQKEREKVLLAIPNFFNSINFTKTEIKEISSLLKI